MLTTAHALSRARSRSIATRTLVIVSSSPIGVCSSRGQARRGRRARRARAAVRSTRPARVERGEPVGVGERVARRWRRSATRDVGADLGAHRGGHDADVVAGRDLQLQAPVAERARTRPRPRSTSSSSAAADRDARGDGPERVPPRCAASDRTTRPRRAVARRARRSPARRGRWLPAHGVESWRPRTAAGPARRASTSRAVSSVSGVVRRRRLRADLAPAVAVVGDDAHEQRCPCASSCSARVRNGWISGSRMRKSSTADRELHDAGA